MGKIIKILKINILSIIALPILLIATVCKLTAKALEKLAIIAGMSMFTIMLCLLFEAIKDPDGLLDIIAVIIVGFLIIAILVFIVRLCASFIIAIWSLTISVLDAIYEFCYMGYLHLHESCEADYKFLQMQGAKKWHPFACLFYTLLHGVSKLIVGFASLSLYLAIALSIVIIIGTIMDLNKRISASFGISFAAYISKIDRFYAVYGIVILVALLATAVLTLLSLGLEWHEWAAELKMSSDEYAEYVSKLQNQQSLQVEKQEQADGADEYVDKFSEHVQSLEQIQNDIDELLAVSDSSVLRSNFSEYLRNMTEIANTCSAYDNTVPEHVFKKLIPQIQALDKQRDNLQKNIERLRQENKDPVKQSVFFSGCNTPEKLEKRYKALCKTYHPDMESGDDETFKALQNEYEMIKKTFS